MRQTLITQYVYIYLSSIKKKVCNNEIWVNEWRLNRLAIDVELAEPAVRLCLVIG